MIIDVSEQNYDSFHGIQIMLEEISKIYKVRVFLIRMWTLNLELKT